MNIARSLWAAVLCLFGLAAPLQAQWTAYGIHIPAGHPRLFGFNEASRRERALAYFRQNSFTPQPQDYFNLAYLHVIGVKGQNCGDAVKWALTDPEGGGSYDHARWNGENVIVIFDWCYDVLTPAQRGQLISQINAALQFYLKYYVHAPANNYFWGGVRNEIDWGIASYGENPSADEILRHGIQTRFEQRFVPYAQGPGAGGTTQEGSGYGVVIPAYPIIPFTTASLFGRDLWDETRDFKDTVFWYIYGTLPAPTYNVHDGKSYWMIFPFNDDEAFVAGGSFWNRIYSYDFMRFAASYWTTSDVGKYAHQWLNIVPLGSLRAIETVNQGAYQFIAAQDPGGPSLPFTRLPLDYYESGNSYFYGRTAWDSSSAVVNWQLSSPKGVAHEHYDWGNWQIWRGGRWLSRETTGYSDKVASKGGAGIETTTTAIGHNMILVNDHSVLPTADDEYESLATVKRLESRPEYAYAATDLTGQYRYIEKVHNFGARHVEREFLYLRALETLIIFDRVKSEASGGTSAEAMHKTNLLHFEQIPRGGPERDHATHITAGNGDQALEVTILLPEKPETRVVNEGGSVGQYRLEVDQSGQAQSYFLTVLQARTRSGASLTANLVDSSPGQVESGTYTVTLHHPTQGKVTVIFNKGETSHGGSVTFAGVTHPLLNRVQTIRYTDSGPAWEELPRP